jgi:hypothetical protein
MAALNLEMCQLGKQSPTALETGIPKISTSTKYSNSSTISYLVFPTLMAAEQLSQGKG